MTTSNAAWLPNTVCTSQGQERCVGVEIEFAGVPLSTIAQSVARLFGGEIKEMSRAECKVVNTKLGDFKLELDATYMKAIAEKQQLEDPSGASFKSVALDFMTRAAEQLVPWEVVSPPIAFSDLHQLEGLVDDLRSRGALGTRNALHFAFGLHLNPEIPNLDAATILRYLRAYLCLYDWIVERERIDTTRRLTSYIKHFDKAYIEKVTAFHYQPDMNQLIDDYLLFSPTRNRSLDLLPLFAHIDEARVRRVVDDPRINARPTFHYRLPNCDIDNPRWGLYFPWKLWLSVEALAEDRERLAYLCGAYRQELSRITHPLESRWASVVRAHLGREPLRK